MLLSPTASICRPDVQWPFFLIKIVDAHLLQFQLASSDSWSETLLLKVADVESCQLLPLEPCGYLFLKIKYIVFLSK